MGIPEWVKHLDELNALPKGACKTYSISDMLKGAEKFISLDDQVVTERELQRYLQWLRVTLRVWITESTNVHGRFFIVKKYGDNK